MIQVHVGQCGCQLGDEFWWQLREGGFEPGGPSAAAASASKRSSGGALPSSSASFSSPSSSDSSSSSAGNSSTSPPSPAVFVDSEPKVVQHLRCPPRPDGVVFEQNGRGNNWAFGYSGSASLCDGALEAIRREVERRDVVRGFNLVHGLSGGTGSGLGSRLVGSLRASFPKLYLLTTSIGGSNFGDTCLQPYNTLLTLQALQDNADVICYYNNDDVGQLLASASSQKHAAGRGAAAAAAAREPFRFSVADTNRLIAQCMVGLFAPVTSPVNGGRAGAGFSNAVMQRRAFDPGEFVSTTVPLPSAKYVSVRCALLPHDTILSSASPSRALVDGVSRAFSKYRQNLRPVQNFAAYWVARGELGPNPKRSGGSASRLSSGNSSVGAVAASQEPHLAARTGPNPPPLSERHLFHPLSMDIMKVLPFAGWNATPIAGWTSCPSRVEVE